MTAVLCFTDFKSPYAYLALDDYFAMEDESGIAFDWLPYTLDIPDYLGSATLDEQGKVVEQNRTAHQWRKVKYAYMDVRRYANLKDLTIRGTTKIWDSTIANIGLLWAKQHGNQAAVRQYLRNVFEPFWRRALDIEDVRIVEQALNDAGITEAGFADFASSKGRGLHDEIRKNAEDRGVFGVPSIIVADELFWGREHLGLIRDRLRKN